MKQFYVYIHKKPDGTPFYVGKSGTNRHKTVWRKHNPYHTRIVSKYGPENIVVEVTQCDSERAAFDLEKIYIQQLREQGYNLCNLTDGGDGVGGYKRTEKEKQLNAERKRGNTYRRGARHTEEAKQKNRQAHLGIKQSQSTIDARKPKLKKPRKSAMGITMVSWYKPHGRWLARISVNGQIKHLGYFESLLDACAARKSAELIVYKDKFV